MVATPISGDRSSVVLAVDDNAQPGSDDAASTRTERGLGLAFCKLAVEAHGGRIWVEAANPGAAFHVLLPGEIEA